MERKIAVIVLYIILIFACIYVFFRYILNLISPFVIAWIVALMIQPIVTVICKKTQIPRKFISVILVLFFMFVIGFVMFFTGERLLYELKAIVDNLTYNTEEILNIVFNFIYKTSDKIPFLNTFNHENLYNMTSDLFKNALTSISAKIPAWIAGLFNTLPNAVFFTIILVMAAFYICADFNGINRFLALQLPKRAVDFIIEVKKHLKSTGLKYIRAYAFMIVITFFQLLIGFSILKIDYSFTIALITAALDILPVIGVGTVLIPWSVVLLISGDYYIGFGLLIIFCIVSLIRQFIEPKIIGVSLGLNPLVTLISMYAGYKIFGFGGLILMPVFVIILKNLNDSGTITLYRI
jgi:sporulation integral membrane protein YtvI